jgi:hypothetical protein
MNIPAYHLPICAAQWIMSRNHKLRSLETALAYDREILTQLTDPKMRDAMSSTIRFMEDRIAQIKASEHAASTDSSPPL